jgi:hypothetical protein
MKPIRRMIIISGQRDFLVVVIILVPFLFEAGVFIWNNLDSLIGNVQKYRIVISCAIAPAI